MTTSLLSLPRELLHLIVRHTPRSVPNLSLTCRELERALDSQEFWKLPCEDLIGMMGLPWEQRRVIVCSRIQYEEWQRAFSEIEGDLKRIQTAPKELQKQLRRKILDCGLLARPVLLKNLSSKDNKSECEDLLVSICVRNVLDRFSVVAQKDDSRGDAHEIHDIIRSACELICKPEEYGYSSVLVDGFVCSEDSYPSVKPCISQVLKEYTEHFDVKAIRKRARGVTAVQMRSHFRLKFMCGFVDVLRRRGHEGVLMVHQRGLSWQGVIRLEDPNEKDGHKYYDIGEGAYIENFQKSASTYRWISPQNLAMDCSTVTCRQLNAPTSYKGNLTTAIDALFVSFGKLFRWASKGGVELKDDISCDIGRGTVVTTQHLVGIVSASVMKFNSI